MLAWLPVLHAPCHDYARQHEMACSRTHAFGLCSGALPERLYVGVGTREYSATRDHSRCVPKATPLLPHLAVPACLLALLMAWLS